MKKLLFLLAILFLFSTQALAYDELTSKEFKNFFTAGQAYDVYENKSLESRVIASIKPGAEVFVIGQGPTEKRGNFYGCWFEVELGAKAGTGYIFADAMLSSNSVLYAETRFIYEHKPDGSKNWAWLTLKALDKNGRLLAQSAPVRTIIREPFLLPPLTSNGLAGVRCIIRLAVSGEACGVPDCYFYYAWTGSELVLLPSSLNLGGAGMEVIYNESVIFPSGGAPRDTIIKVLKSTEFLVHNEEEESIKGVDYAAQIYLWDGKRALPQKQNPKLFDWYDRHLNRWYSKK